MTVNARSAQPALDIDRLLLLSVRVGVYLVLLMPLIITRETFFPFIVGKALYARAMTEVLLGLWLVLAIRVPRYRPARSWLLLALAIYLGVTTLAAFTGVSSQRSLWSTYERMQGVVDLAHWVAFALVVTSVHRSLQDWRLLLNVNLGVSLAMALIGLAQHHDVDLPIYGFLETGGRLSGTLGNATYVGAYMMVNVLIGLGFLSQSLVESWQSKIPPTTERRRRERRKGRNRQSRGGFSSVFWWRVFWSVVVLADLWVLTLSGSRGAVFGLAAGLMGFAVGYGIWGHWRPLKVGAAVVAGFLVAVAFILLVAKDAPVIEKITNSNPLLHRIASTNRQQGSVKDRLASLSYGLEGFAERPILGWGPENYVVAWGRFYDSEADVRYTFDQAHNKVVEELTTKGAVGLVSYMSLWVLMLLILLRTLRHQGSNQQMLIWFVGAAYVGYFAQNLFLFDTPSSVLQFMLLLGFVVNVESTFGDSAPSRLEGQSTGKSQHSRMNEDLDRGSLRGMFRSFGAKGALHQKWMPWFGLVVLSILVSLTVYFLNVKSYQAATAVVDTAQPRITWAERFGYFERSIDSFNPLANYVRIAMFTALSDNWRTLSDEEAELALAIVEREAQPLIASEPQWWRAYVDLARVYLAASSSDPTHLAQAREYFEKAAELAPETRKVAGVGQQLEQAESRVEGAEPNSQQAPNSP